VLKLVGASAVLCGRTVADGSDLWVLRHVWDRAEQIGPLASLVAGLLDRSPTIATAHPRARRPDRVDPEALAAELDRAEETLRAGPKLVDLARLREQVQSVADRAAWVTDAAGRGHLLARAASVTEKLG
jgi:MoxR-like ATPase